MKKKPQQQHRYLHRFISGLAVMIFALGGVILLAITRAAAPAISIETENGVVTTQACITSDTTASNNTAVKFGSTICNGALPALSSFPNATNTGVPTGVTLTAYTGPSTITQAGTVIDSKLLTTTLVIADGADNVVIRNSIIRSGGYYSVLDDGTAKNLQIIDTELDGLGDTSNNAAVAGSNLTLTRVNIHGTGDGIKLGSNVTIQDCYIHDLAVTSDSHNDGIQSLGSDDAMIRHNTIIANDGATSAVILSTGSADSMRRITMMNNLFGGGAYTIYGGYQEGADDLSKVSDIFISHNYFTTTANPRSGAYGPWTSVDQPAVTLSGNVWYDGPNAGKPVN